MMVENLAFWNRFKFAVGENVHFQMTDWTSENLESLEFSEPAEALGRKALLRGSCDNLHGYFFVLLSQPIRLQVPENRIKACKFTLENGSIMYLGAYGNAA
jgi:hypothetical protein